MSAKKDDRSEIQPQGILITKGMDVVIPISGLQLTLNEGGVVTGSLKLHMSFDMTPHWVTIALDHLRACKLAAADLDACWKNGTQPQGVRKL